MLKAKNPFAQQDYTPNRMPGKKVASGTPVNPRQFQAL
jgi:hypothetical protein